MFGSLSCGFTGSVRLASDVDPAMLLGEFNDALSYLQDLRAGQRRRDGQEQLREFLPEFGMRQDVAQLLIDWHVSVGWRVMMVRRGRCRERGFKRRPVRRGHGN